MSNKGQIDGIILSVSFLTLALIAILFVNPGGMTGFVSASAVSTPTPTPIILQPTPTKAPTATPYNGVPIIDQTYYVPPQATAQPTPYNYYNYPNNYNNYPNNYQYPSTYPNGTLYYPPGYQNQYNTYCYTYTHYNGTRMYSPECNYGNQGYPYYYSNGYPKSIKIISGVSPVDISVDGINRGRMPSSATTYIVIDLSVGYHIVYVKGYNCDKTEQVYVSDQYQTTLNVCDDVASGNHKYTGDGTYYLFQGDQVTTNGNTIFKYTGFSEWESGHAAVPYVTFYISPSYTSSQSVSLYAGSESSYAGGQIRVNGAVRMSTGDILVGVTVSSSGNFQPSPIGSRKITGRITYSNGTGIAGASIFIVSSFNPRIYMNTRYSTSDGQYTIDMVPDGTYNITVNAENHYKTEFTEVAISSDYYHNYVLSSKIVTPTPTATPTSTVTPTPTPTAMADLKPEEQTFGTIIFAGTDWTYTYGQSYYTQYSNGFGRYPAYFMKVSNIGNAISAPYNIAINNDSLVQNAVYQFAGTTPPFPALAISGAAFGYVYGTPTSDVASIGGSINVDPNLQISDSNRSNNMVSFNIPISEYTTPLSNTYITNTPVTHSGLRMLYVEDIDNDQEIGAMQIVPATNGSTYTFSGYAVQTFSNQMLSANIAFLDENRKNIGAYVTYITTTNNWAPFTTSFSSPVSTAYVAVTINSSQQSVAKVYFDDMRLSNETETNLLSNPGFENLVVNTAHKFNTTTAALNRWTLIVP